MSTTGIRSVLVSILALSMVTSGGCALFREPVPPGFDSVYIQGLQKTKGGRVAGDMRADTVTKRVLIGGAIGAVTVGAFAAGASALSCLPGVSFPLGWIMCETTTGAWVTGVGAALGFASGGVLGGVTGLSFPDAKSMSSTLQGVAKSRELGGELGSALYEALPPGKVADQGSQAQAKVVARVDDIDLKQYQRDRLALRFRASMKQEWQGNESTCEYEYTTLKSPVNEWLEGGGSAITAAFDEAIGYFSAWMARDLAAFAAGEELEATLLEPRSCFREKRGFFGT